MGPQGSTSSCGDRGNDLRRGRFFFAIQIPAIFFVSVLYADSLAIYHGSFDPPTQADERIVRCVLGDRSLSSRCEELGKAISRVVILVNEGGEEETFASTRERVLMSEKAFQEFSDRVEVLASTPAEASERTRALLADSAIEQVFYIIRQEPDLNLEVPADNQAKIIWLRFPLEHENGSRDPSSRPQVAGGAREVVKKLGLYQPLDEHLVDLQKSLFNESWAAFLNDLTAACPFSLTREACERLTLKWQTIWVTDENQAKKMDRRRRLFEQNLLVYKPSQSEDRWAERFVRTAMKPLDATEEKKKLQAVAQDLVAKTVQGYPYGKVHRLRRMDIQAGSSSVQPWTVAERPLECSAPDGRYHMDIDRYLADRFPEAFARFLENELRHASSIPIELYVHNHSVEQAYEFHRRDRFETFYFLQTRRGQQHRDIHLALRTEPRAYRIIFTSVRGNNRQANVLCQIQRAGVFGRYRFVQSGKEQPLFVLNAQGRSLTLDENDLLLFGFKGNWSRTLTALNWERTPLVTTGLDIDLFTQPLIKRKLIVARNVYGDDTDIVLKTLYDKGLRRVVYLGSAGAVADYRIGDVIIPNEFVTRKHGSVPFPDNFAADFLPALSNSLTVHGRRRHGWVPTLFHETKDLLLHWRAESIGAVDVEGWHLGKFARGHPDLKMAAFFVISDATLGESTITETNAHRGIIDGSVNRLISFLVRELLHPEGFAFNEMRPYTTVEAPKPGSRTSPAHSTGPPVNMSVTAPAE